VYDLLNIALGVKGLDIRDVDPIYLCQNIVSWLDLDHILVENIALSNLRTENRDKDNKIYLVSLKESRIYKALDGNNTELISRDQINYFGDTNISRFERLADSVKNNRFDLSRPIAILNNDGFWIRDGCHRASIVLHEHGDIDVKVIRLYFKDNLHNDETDINSYNFSVINEGQSSDRERDESIKQIHRRIDQGNIELHLLHDELHKRIDIEDMEIHKRIDCIYHEYDCLEKRFTNESADAYNKLNEIVLEKIADHYNVFTDNASNKYNGVINAIEEMSKSIRNEQLKMMELETIVKNQIELAGKQTYEINELKKMLSVKSILKRIWNFPIELIRRIKND
jgi:hypothetical protein